MAFASCDLEPSSPMTFCGKLSDFPVAKCRRKEPAR
jgi:hypothetical protein